MGTVPREFPWEFPARFDLSDWLCSENPFARIDGFGMDLMQRFLGGMQRFVANGVDLRPGARTGRARRGTDSSHGTPPHKRNP